MAAIIPHLEQPDQTTPLEKQYYRCIAGEPNLNGAFADGAYCPSPTDVIAEQHKELLSMVYVRNAVEQSLVGRTFTVQNGKPGKNPRTGEEQIIDPYTVYIVLDGPIGEGPPWNPAASPMARAYNLLTWTSKMNAPSFSIPAGAPEIGGSCPGATAGQSLVPTKALVRSEKILQSVTGESVDLSRAICARCYATGGQYGTGGVQFAQALRFIWVREAIRQSIMTPHGESTLFIETMVAAISNADFYLAGGSVKKDAEGVATQKLLPEHTGRRFFRIHDSGDFFAPEYLAQWKRVCERLPDITFWAPSRVWALGKPWIDAVNRINGAPGSNLVIRPSAYHVDGPCPTNLGPGWASGSTVYTHDAGGQGTAFEWQCDAYATGSNRTCRGATAPPGLGAADGRGCRACWIAPELRVNYSPH